MTPDQHLEVAWAQLCDLTARDRPYLPNLVVERRGEAIAVASVFTPAEMTQVAGAMLASFNGDRVALLMDVYGIDMRVPAAALDVTIREIGELSPADLFAAGDPRACEALMALVCDVDGARSGMLRYHRDGTRLISDGRLAHDDKTLIGMIGRSAFNEDYIAYSIRAGATIRDIARSAAPSMGVDSDLVDYHADRAALRTMRDTFPKLAVVTMQDLGDV